MSEQIFPEDIGRLPMVEKVAAGVKIAMERAGITDPSRRPRSRPPAPAALGVGDGLEGQQRRLGLDVVHVGRVGDAGPLHRDLHPGGDLLDHRQPADVLGQDLLAHRVADRQPRLVGGRRPCRRRVRREDGRVRRDDPVGAAGPDDRDLLDLVHRPGAACLEHLAERAVGDDPGVVVDAAVALGLADDGDHPVGLDQALVDQVGEAGGVGDALQSRPCGPRWARACWSCSAPPR